MATISPDRLSDIPEQDPSMLEDVSEAERDVWHRLSLLSAEVRRSVNGAMNSQAGEEASTQFEDLPAGEQRAFRAQEGRGRAIRAGLREEHLRTIPIPIAFRAEVEVSGVPAQCTLEFNPRIFSGTSIRSEADLRGILHGAANAAAVTGLSIPDVPGGVALTAVTFNAAQQDAIAKSFMQHRNIQQIVSDGGVHEANVRTALLFAQDHPTEVAEVLQSASVKADTEIQALKAKKEIASVIDALGNISSVSCPMNFELLDQEITNLRNDQAGLPNPGYVPVSDYMTTTMHISTDYGTAGINTAAERGKYSRYISEQIASYHGVRKYYDNIEDKLHSIWQQCGAAGVNIPASLSAYVNATGVVQRAALDTTFAPKVIADAVRHELSLESADAYNTQIREKEGEKKEKGEKKLTGMEAVLAIYEKHFELQGSTRPRDAARELFARNEVGRQEVQESLHVANKKEVFGEQDRLADWSKRQLKQVALGSQETYMANLGQALGLGRYEGTGSFSFMRGTRRFFSPWAKFNARPAWGAMDYPQLLTSYYALREAVQAGHLTNSAYVRRQRDEIIRLLSSKFMKKFVADFDANAMTDNGEEDVRAGVTGQLRKRVQNALRNLYAGDAPEPYGGDAKAAVEEAARHTASVRKFIGRSAAATAKFGYNYGVKKPVVLAAKVVAKPFKLGKGALKSFWAWGTRPAKVFG